MARLPRLVVPNHLHHIVARGNNDQPIVLDDADCQHFLSSLRDSAQRTGVAIHAYVLMPSRVQLMATPSDAEGLGKLMQDIGRHYVPYFNARHGRSGNLWEGRFRATVMEADTYFLACAQLIEQQPVAAYQQLAQASGSAELIADIEAATRKAWPLGSEEFRRRLGKLTDRRLEPARRGRPRKQPAAERS